MRAYPLERIEKFGLGASAEGVLVDKQGSLFGCGRDGTVYKIDRSGVVMVIARVEGGSANGIVMDRSGDLIYCDVARHALIRVTQAGAVSVVTKEIAGVSLALPNFATYDQEGNLYVTNSSYRNREDMLHEFMQPEPNGSLLRLRRDGRGDVVARNLYLANGAAIDPKEEAIFVLQSLRNNCLRIPIRRDGSHGKPEVFAERFPGMPDGMAFARDGSLYVTICSATPDSQGQRAEMNKVLRVDQSGRWSEFIDDPGGVTVHHPTNCAFGGEDMSELFVASHSTPYFCRVRTDFVGHPLYHQR